LIIDYARTVNRLDLDTARGDFYWDFDAIFKDGTKIHTKGRKT